MLVALDGSYQTTGAGCSSRGSDSTNSVVTFRWSATIWAGLAASHLRAEMSEYSGYLKISTKMSVSSPVF